MSAKISIKMLDKLNRIIMLEHLVYNGISEETRVLRYKFETTKDEITEAIDGAEKRILHNFYEAFNELKLQCLTKQKQIRDMIEGYSAILPAALKEVEYHDIETCVNVFEEARYLHDKYSNLDLYILLHGAQYKYMLGKTSSHNENVAVNVTHFDLLTNKNLNKKLN